MTLFSSTLLPLSPRLQTFIMVFATFWAYLYSVHVELAPPKPLITYEWKQLRSCGLHRWKKRGKAASDLKAQPIYLAGKCCFKFLYKSLWGYQMPQHYRLKHALILACAFPSTAHLSRLFLTIDTKLRYLAAFLLLLFLGCYGAIWVLSSC